MSASQSFVAATASAPGCTITNIKQVGEVETVEQLTFYHDSEDIPTIFPYGRKMVITIDASHVEGQAGKTGAVAIAGAPRAQALPAPGTGATFTYSGTGMVVSVTNSAPQVDGGVSVGQVVIVVPLALPS